MPTTINTPVKVTNCSNQPAKAVLMLQLKEALGIKTDMGTAAFYRALENVQLLDSKQQDYGSGNINRHGIKGVLVRIDDKSARLTNLANKQAPPNHESAIDSWKDICNYAIIGQLNATGEWK